jgi:energy-coupling factor transporter ATP-binding protein EcfA2
MIPINQKFLDALSPQQRAVALTKKGFKFIFQFIFKKGDHLFVVGQTGSGKTQKLYFLVNWLRHTRETVIWLDSAKQDEILPLVTMGTPVNLIVPKGCSVTLEIWDPDQKKYIKMPNHPLISSVSDPGSTWWALKKKHINILCFRNAFEKEKNRLQWMGELFETLATWTRRKIMPKIYPFAFFGDESQWFNVGLRLSGDTDRRLLSDLITEHALTLRAAGGRLIFATQGYKNLPPAARANFPNNLLCRNTQVTSEENPALSRFNRYTPYLLPAEGFFVYSDGECYPAKRQWTFPLFPSPKIRVVYRGSFDERSPDRILSEEIETEMVADFSKYNSLLQDLIGYEVPATPNRYEVLR